MAKPKLVATNEIKIDKGVPLSKPRTSNGDATRKYPLPSLEIGDSFFVPGAVTAAFASTPANYGKKHGRKFRCRTVTESGVQGTRVWRIE